MTRGGDRLAWPAVGGEAAAVLMQGDAKPAQKLDSAMNVLTTLLSDLENELRDVSGISKDAVVSSLPPSKIVLPGVEGVSGKVEKLDTALDTLTMQLAELERELRVQDSPKSPARSKRDALQGQVAEVAAATSPSPVSKHRSQLSPKKDGSPTVAAVQLPAGWGVQNQRQTQQSPHSRPPAEKAQKQTAQPASRPQSQPAQRQQMPRPQQQQQPVQQSQQQQPPSQSQQPPPGRGDLSHSSPKSKSGREFRQSAGSAVQATLGSSTACSATSQPHAGSAVASSLAPTWNPGPGIRDRSPSPMPQALPGAPARGPTPLMSQASRASPRQLQSQQANQVNPLPLATTGQMPGQAVTPRSGSALPTAPAAAGPQAGGASPLRGRVAASPAYPRHQGPARCSSAPQNPLQRNSRRTSQSPIHVRTVTAPGIGFLPPMPSGGGSTEALLAGSSIGRPPSGDNSLTFPSVSYPGALPGPPEEIEAASQKNLLPQNQLISAAAMASAAVASTAGMNPTMPFGGPGPVLALGGRQSPGPMLGGSANSTPTHNSNMQLPGPPSLAPGGFRSPSNPKIGLSRSDMTHSPMARRHGDGAQSPAVMPPAPTGFMCRSSTSITSSNPSFYMPTHSAAGGSPFGIGTAPVPAASYVADLGDQIDHMFGTALRVLEPGAASKLMLRRIAPARYEIDGRKVTLRWSEQPSVGLVVTEDEVSGSEMPLTAYLSQAGNVAASLSGQKADMPKISRVPKERRLTFADGGQAEKHLAAHIDKLGNERCESMRLAVEQARLREEAADAYERYSRRQLPPPPGMLNAGVQLR
eukprot:TRINITY_DN77347_c0_g1_i1.p1 TRINITY_DN77347_c0_g1~~TRINITY_DN77347_c0_g1_i1.p1  ORF type:complete len:810 (-),score=155.28 TRINITY_DN77347_c0_g1_i1:80-2509(-)